MIFQLQPEAKITGRVTDERGQPLEGVEVSVAMISALGSDLLDLTPTAEFLDLRESRLGPRAKTGADGRVALGGLPPQRRLWLDLQRPGRHAGQVFAATTEQPQPEVRGPEETPRGDVELALIPVHAGSFTAVLRPAKRIAGTIVDADTGKPLAGIDVKAYGRPHDQYGGLFQPIDSQKISDGSGRFVFPDLPKPVYHVLAGPQKAGPYLGRLRIVAPRADQPEVDVRIELPRGEPVAGRVLSKKDGKGIPEVSVVYKPKDGDDIFKWADGALFTDAAKTDSDGRFRLLLPPGTGSVEVSPQMGKYFSYPPRAQPPEDVQQVEVVPGRAHPELFFSIAPPEAGGNSSTRGVGMAGASTGSSAGKAAPYPFAEVRPPIEGTVVDPEGRPVADAIVGLQPWFESRIDTINRRANSGSSFDVDEKLLAKRFAHTDASGRFSLGEVGVNEWGSIEAIHRERQLVGLVQLPDAPRPGVAEPPLSIWLSAAGSVSGIAQKDGQPCRGVRVRIEEAPLRVVLGRNDDDSKPDYRTRSASELPAPLASFKDSTETDAQGRFHFATVPANKEFVVRVYPRDLVPEKNRYSARVKAGENTELPPFLFLPTDESISGIVVDPQGQPIAGATLVAYTGPDVLHDAMIPKARVKSTGADGRFTMTGLPKIPVVLSVGLMVPDGAGGQRYQGPVAQIRVQPGQTDVRIEVKQKPAATEGTSPPPQSRATNESGYGSSSH